MFWIVFLYLIISVIPAIVNLFDNTALGWSILFGSLLAVFAGGGLKGSFYGNKLQKIGGFVSAVIFMLIAYWLSSKFSMSIKGFSFTGLEWVIIGFFVGLLFVSKSIALGKENIKLNLITPQETIKRLVRLRLSNQEFSQIHHLKGAEGECETIDSHVEYLDNIQKYQNKESNNYIVGLRLAYLEELKKSGFDVQTAIEKCKIEYPFNEAL